MKFRYLLVALLAFGFILFAALSLVLEVSDIIERHAPASTAGTVSENQPVAEPENEAAPPAAQTVPAAQTHATPAVPEAKPSADNLYDTQNLQEILREYAAEKPKEWSEQVNGMVQKVNVPHANERILFLTFNVYTKNHPELFNFLRQHAVKATFFLSGMWVRRHAGQAKEIGALPALFEIENHGNRNIPLSASGADAYGRKGTGNLAAALDEITAGAEAIKNATGQTPRYIRSFLNYTDNVVVDALSEAGIKTIGISVFADGGGLFGTEKIKNQILNAPNGSIILLSINPDYPTIFNGLKAAIEEIELLKSPVRFEKLADYEQYFIYI
ncbi:MAG: polysaccharide deacetylase family protein [Prevotellaceae bacterium]|jgi:peptidoglycan/xylan/chitin deacetylase (PgdA/CDA1 family)|nr:polysaccharide deacetylase family protein [Prevotellaceae bacterium]